MSEREGTLAGNGRMLRSRLCVHASASVALLILCAAAPIGAQSAGFERFQRILEGGLVSTKGVTSVQWLPDGRGYLERENAEEPDAFHFYVVDPATGRRTPLLDSGALGRLRSSREFSTFPAQGVPFASVDVLPGSTIGFEVDGSAFLFETSSGRLRALRRPTGLSPSASGAPNGRFSPDHRYFSYSREHDDLRVMSTETGAERVLFEGTGVDKLLAFVGLGPWYAWSPDGRWIAFVTGDEEGLTDYPLVRGAVAAHLEVEPFTYPFATDPDPSLELRVVNVETGATRTIWKTTDREPYLRDLLWTPGGSELTFATVGPWQSRLELRAWSPETERSRTLLVEQEPAYLDPPFNLRFLGTSGEFLWSSQRTGLRQLYRYGPDGSGLEQLTDGDEETGLLHGVDEVGGWAYIDAFDDLGAERHLDRVRLDGSARERLTGEGGVHRISMDEAARYALDVYSTRESPVRAVIRRGDGTVLQTLATSDAGGVSALGLEPPEELLLTTADEVTEMRGVLFRPVDFDPARSYPLILYVYGGPHSRFVTDEYRTDAMSAAGVIGSGILPPAAVAQLGFLFLMVDGRGIPYRGKAYQTANYMRIGGVDVDDQAAAARQIAARPYVDETRIGVAGISHGGWMTLMLMLRYPDLFKAGVAGAPVTDLANGPKQYIGRMMRTPEANAEGYRLANPVPLAEGLRGRLLIYHGTLDQNAVFANSLQLVDAFVSADRPVDFMIYPDGAHVMAGQRGMHAMKSAVSYFLQHLRPDGWEETWAAMWAR